jgi:hypothetical protein
MGIDALRGRSTLNASASAHRGRAMRATASIAHDERCPNGAMHRSSWAWS